MRWYAWVIVSFFAAVAALGLLVMLVSRNYVSMLRDGSWVNNELLSDAMAASMRGGEDPLELFQWYVGFGLAIFLFGIVAAAVAAVLGVVLKKRAHASPVSAQAYVAPARPPAGWYPMQDGSGHVAWWNGDRWDDSVMSPSDRQGP